MPFLIDDALAIAALVASAGMSAYSNNQAAKKQQNALREAQARQLAQQNEATRTAARRAADFDPTTRQQQQDQIQQQLTQGYEREVAAPQITAQGVQVGSTLPTGQGSTEYLTSKARETAKSAASLRALAALMGRTGAATELRRNEATALGDTAGEIGRIQTGAGNLWQADQGGIAVAGQPNMFANVASAALGAYGTNKLAGSGVGKKPLPGGGSNPMFPEYGMASGPSGAWV